MFFVHFTNANNLEKKNIQRQSTFDMRTFFVFCFLLTLQVDCFRFVMVAVDTFIFLVSLLQQMDALAELQDAFTIALCKAI